MSSRRTQSLPPHMFEPKPERGKCITAICFSWKVITCLVSHVTLVLLVVSYCVGGAYLFQHLEKPHEMEVKKNIHNIRLNLTDKIWKFSDNASVLSESDWISNVKKDLANFEKDILKAMKTYGWDGDEDITKSQWTFAGSLFYSIIVITTIGYGHISPRTDWGKVTTIFYAIVGIPLMLLCLSNIGDVMATSFRFIYWRVCCYVCTKTAKRPRNRSRQRSMRSHRYSSRSQPPPFRRSMKMTQRSANDSGVGNSIGISHAYSDPELRTIGRGDYERGHHRMSGGSGGRRHYQPPPQQQQQLMVAPPSPRPHPHQSRHGRYTMPPYEHEVGLYGDRAPPQYTQTLNRSSRFSSRQRNRDMMRERHTVERERHLSRSRQRFDSIEDLNGPPLAKRSLSVRSVRSPHHSRPPQDFGRGEVAAPLPPQLSPAVGHPESREMRELNRLHTLPRGRSMPNPHRGGRAKSVDPRSHYQDVDEEVVRKTPIISNRYALNYELEQRELRPAKMRSQSMPRSAHMKSAPEPRTGRQIIDRQPQSQPQQQRHHHQHNDHSLPHGGGGGMRRQISSQHSRYGDRLELPEFAPPHMRTTSKRGRSPHPDEYDEEFDDYYSGGGGGGGVGVVSELADIEAGGYDDDYPPVHPTAQSRHRERKPRRERVERLPPSPRIMSPMGFAVKRQIRRRPSYDYDDDSQYGDEWSDYYGDISPKERPVPIWLCVFLVISYILGGAALFAYWENWKFLDSAYFCFITLTTIGFGDFVPAKGVKDESEQSIAYCSLYLLFGIALLAMSFNLVQEEFIANVKEVARRLGILKDDEEDD